MAALHPQAFNEAQHARVWVGSLERECEPLRHVTRARGMAWQSSCKRRDGNGADPQGSVNLSLDRVALLSPARLAFRAAWGH
jgi:hypothetical protein